MYMGNLLIIDYFNIVRRVMDNHRNLRYKGMRTGGLFGFLQMFFHYVIEYSPLDGIIVCYDVPTYKRKLIYPDYKLKKQETPQDTKDYFAESKEYIDEFLSLGNIPVWGEKGYECDDLIALLVEKYKAYFNRVIICSNDDDLFQLLDHNVCIQRSKKLYTIKHFWEAYPELIQFEDPSIWFEVTALCGNHNNVKNIYPKLGPKTALKIISDQVAYNKFCNTYSDKLAFNIRLTALPFDYDLRGKVPKVDMPPDFDIETFLEKYGIKLSDSIIRGYNKLCAE